METRTGPPWEARKFSRVFIIVGALLILGVVITACGQPSTPAPAPAPVEVVQPPPPTAVPQPVDAPAVQAPAQPPAQTAPEPIQEPEPAGPEPIDAATLQLIQAMWEGSPHGSTYDLGKGPNTYCSRCHSPQNWDPASQPGPPPNCITCKFPTDAELRIAPTMDFVSEEDWVGISCETCHLTVDGILQSDLAWFNPLTREDEPVNTPNELCTKCHLTTAGVRASGGRGVTHEIVLGGSAHANWAGALPQVWRPQYCSDCHNPHTTEPKQCVDCHEGVLTLDKHMKGTAEAHVDLSCLACHDASGMQVGPHPDPNQNGVWTTLVSSVSRSGDVVTAYEKSHSVQWQVDCSRCHYAENPWELEVLTPAGTVPAPPAPPSN
jgi:hypothetical protein